jgi:hypothetical protein
LPFEAHLDPDHLAAGGARRRRELVDIGHDLARGRHLDRHARQHENILQVDHHQRGLRPDQAVVAVEPAALRFHLREDGLIDGDLVHGFPPGGSREISVSSFVHF